MHGTPADLNVESETLRNGEHEWNGALCAGVVSQAQECSQSAHIQAGWVRQLNLQVTHT